MLARAAPLGSPAWEWYPGPLMNDSRAPMRRARALRALLPLMTLVLLVATTGCEPRLRLGKTNVVLVIVDTLRADHLGCYGYDKPTSANIDALAAEGLVFDKTIANCSWTRPSIASLLTGTYPRTTGVYKEKFDALSPEVVTLAEMFQVAGYATYGVTANPSINGVFGFDRGFDQYGDCGVVWPWMMREDGQEKFKRGEILMEDADSITDRAMEVLAQHDEGAFYLQVLYVDPHTPYDAPDHFVHELNQHPLGLVEQYDSEVAFVDQELGRLLDSIRLEHPNTLFIITSDHGEGLDDHLGMTLSRTHGYHLYESNLHVPLIFHHPRIDPGHFAGTVQLLDLVPTLADLFRLELDEQVVGTSLKRILKGKTPPALPAQIFSESQFKEVDKVCVREDGLKYMINRDFDALEAGLTPKLLQRPGLQRVCRAIQQAGSRELYTIPGEENPVRRGFNRIADDPETAQRLEQAILDWEARTESRPPINRNFNREVDDTVVRQLRALGYLDGADPEAEDQSREAAAAGAGDSDSSGD